jgi:hypothetical protein
LNLCHGLHHSSELALIFHRPDFTYSQLKSPFSTNLASLSSIIMEVVQSISHKGLHDFLGAVENIFSDVGPWAWGVVFWADKFGVDLTIQPNKLGCYIRFSASLRSHLSGTTRFVVFFFCDRFLFLLTTHLVNQSLAHEVIALQILVLLFERPTNDSIEIAVGFTREVGAFFEWFCSFLNEGKISQRVRYMIEVLMHVIPFYLKVWIW